VHFLADGLVIRALPGKGGKGVFAARPFARGSLLAVYGGIIISGVELKKLSAEEKAYTLQVEDDLHQLTPIDKIGGPDFINHSCEPNAGLLGTISLVALHAIHSDEEIAGWPGFWVPMRYAGMQGIRAARRLAATGTATQISKCVFSLFAAAHCC
jgi:hypothetical protein